MKGHLEGDAGTITTSGVSGPISMQTLKNIPHTGVRTTSFTFVNGNPYGGTTVYVGPNGKAAFPLDPPAAPGGRGSILTLENVEPSQMMIDDRGNASILFYVYGGECLQDAL